MGKLGSAPVEGNEPRTRTSWNAAPISAGRRAARRLDPVRTAASLLLGLAPVYLFWAYLVALGLADVGHGLERAGLLAGAAVALLLLPNLREPADRSRRRRAGRARPPAGAAVTARGGHGPLPVCRHRDHHHQGGPDRRRRRESVHGRHRPRRSGSEPGRRRGLRAPLRVQVRAGDDHRLPADDRAVRLARVHAAQPDRPAVVVAGVAGG